MLFFSLFFFLELEQGIIKPDPSSIGLNKSNSKSRKARKKGFRRSVYWTELPTYSLNPDWLPFLRCLDPCPLVVYRQTALSYARASHIYNICRRNEKCDVQAPAIQCVIRLKLIILKKYEFGPQHSNHSLHLLFHYLFPLNSTPPSRYSQPSISSSFYEPSTKQWHNITTSLH